jgi:quercetin dioxygenase-like cupin family protein
MAKITARDLDTTGAADAPGPPPGSGAIEVAGASRTQLCGPPDFSLWLAATRLEAGTTWRWQAPHGDEALYVQSGNLTLDGRACPPGGTVVVESGAQPTIEAPETTTVVHMGPADPRPPTDGPAGPPRADGHDAHVVGPGGTWAQAREGGTSRYFADSTCPTCRLTLLMVARGSDFASPVHTHSQDELIHVLEGSILLGRRELGPGATLSVGADVRYTFKAGPGGFRLINYRRDASWQGFVDGRPPLFEGGEVNGFDAVMDLVEAEAPGAERQDT